LDSWQEQFGSLSVMEVREMKQLKEENARLKQLVAELSLDRHMLQEVTAKKL
jgi:putative transposase